MPFAANAKHHFGLFLLSVGFLAAAVGGCGLAIVIAGVAAGEKLDEGLLTRLVCSAASGLSGLWLFWRGLRTRWRAIEAGSTAHIPADGTGHTTRSGVAKPSFLEDGKDDRPGPALDHRGRNRIVD